MNDHCFAIPAYKDSPYLEDCIKSILNQTIKSKIIICTSTPTRQNKMLADKYGIPYFVNDKGLSGIAHDWNFAINSANSRLVTIAHQDDIYETEFAATVTKSMDAQTQISFTDYSDIHGDQIKKYTFNHIVKTLLLFPFLFKNKIRSIFFKKLVLSIGDPICCPSVTINKQLITDFNFSADFECVLDWHTWYGLAKQEGSFVFIHQRLMQHRVHEASETSNQIKLGKRRVEEESMLQQIWGKNLGKWIAWVYQLGQLENKS
jgi:glycosyltransferase involved in cell wall biosynthesis